MMTSDESMMTSSTTLDAVARKVRTNVDDGPELDITSHVCRPKRSGRY
jgi:hypothetical protein